MFVDINIAGQRRSTLVDTGASHLFMSRKAADKLGLTVEESTGVINIVNSKGVPFVGVVRGMELRVGDWTSKETFEVIHLDDYDFVLGLSFLYRVNALPCSFYRLCLHPEPSQTMHRTGAPRREGGDQVTKEATLEELEEPKPSEDMRPAELPEGKPPMGKVLGHHT
ncbi:hypothetical protein V6N13_082080 [Hibiscus sabdariffa]